MNKQNLITIIIGSIVGLIILGGGIYWIISTYEPSNVHENKVKIIEEGKTEAKLGFCGLGILFIMGGALGIKYHYFPGKWSSFLYLSGFRKSRWEGSEIDSATNIGLGIISIFIGLFFIMIGIVI